MQTNQYTAEGNNLQHKDIESKTFTALKKESQKAFFTSYIKRWTQ